MLNASLAALSLKWRKYVSLILWEACWCVLRASCCDVSISTAASPRQPTLFFYPLLLLPLIYRGICHENNTKFVIRYSILGRIMLSRFWMCRGLSVAPISVRVIMYVFRLDVGARHFPSRRATVCDCHREYPPGGWGQLPWDLVRRNERICLPG